MRVTLRGMSNDNPVFQGMQASTPTVAVNMDGAYTNRNSAGNNLFDIERVEVLFGPQSTMYSSPSPGGVVNIVTANPKLEKFEGSATLEAGDYNLIHGEAIVNIPVVEKFALRVAASYLKRDGYLTNDAEDEDTQSGRLKALYQPTEDLSIVAIAELSKNGGQGFGGVQIFDFQDGHYIGENGTVDLNSPVTNPWQSDSENDAPGVSNDKTNEKYSAQIDWDMGVGSLSILPSYTPRDNETNELSTDRRTGDLMLKWEEQSGYEKSIEARMTSPEDFMFKWVAGLVYYHSLDEVFNNQRYADTLELSSEGHRYQDNESRAVYANITYPLTDALRATGGVRYTDESNYSSNYESGRNNNEPEVVDMEYSDPDYKIGIEYDLSESSMMYADYSTSYRTQGMGTDSEGNPFPPEKLDAITLGAKNRFFDNRVQVNASAYYYIYENYMAVTGVGTVSDNYGGVENGHLDYNDLNGNGVFDIGVDELLDGVSTGNGPGQNGAAMDEGAKQVGDAKVYGVDLQTSTVVTENFRVDLSVSYLRKYFTELYFDFKTITEELGVPDLDYSGKDMTFAPKWTVNLTLNYDFPLWNGGTLTPRFDTRYQTSYKMYFLDEIVATDRDRDTNEIVITRTDVSTAATQEDYHISNFSLAYVHPNGKWSLTGYVKNLEDYAVKRSIVVMGGTQDMMIGAPRTCGAIFSYKF
jgi:iron complex outermembrane receptor protein